MALQVELKMLIEHHTHAGQPVVKGDIITTNPERAARMIAQGFAEKVGVRDEKSEAVAEMPDKGSED
jgi:hypothetical protein